MSVPGSEANKGEEAEAAKEEGVVRLAYNRVDISPRERHRAEREGFLHGESGSGWSGGTEFDRRSGARDTRRRHDADDFIAVFQANINRIELDARDALREPTTMPNPILRQRALRPIFLPVLVLPPHLTIYPRLIHIQLLQRATDADYHERDPILRLTGALCDRKQRGASCVGERELAAGYGILQMERCWL